MFVLKIETTHVGVGVDRISVLAAAGLTSGASSLFGGMGGIANSASGVGTNSIANVIPSGMGTAPMGVVSDMVPPQMASVPQPPTAA